MYSSMTLNWGLKFFYNPFGRFFRGSKTQNILMSVWLFATFVGILTVMRDAPILSVPALLALVLPKLLTAVLVLGTTSVAQPEVTPANAIRKGLGAIVSNKWVFGFVIVAAYALDYWLNDDSLVKLLPNLAAADRWVPILSPLLGRQLNIVTFIMWILMQLAELAGFQYLRAWIAVRSLEKKEGYDKYNWPYIKSQLIQSWWVGAVFFIASGYDWANLLYGIYGNADPMTLGGDAQNDVLAGALLLFNNLWLGVGLPLICILGQEGLIFLGESLSETFTVLGGFDKKVVEANAQIGIRVRPPSQRLASIRLLYAAGFVWPPFHPTSDKMEDVGNDNMPKQIPLEKATLYREEGWVRISVNPVDVPDWAIDKYYSTTPAA